MSQWQECKLGDVIEVKHGYAFKGEYFTDEQTENILLSPGNFQIGGGFKADKLKYYNGKVPADYVLQQNNVIVTMTDLSKNADTLGYSAVVPNILGKKLLHNQRLGRIFTRTDTIDIMFINWLLRTEEYRWHIIGSASGSTVSHTSPSRIYEYQFPLPPLPEQRAIAGVLSSLDDKIDLLHRQNKTLESLAETLWRQMFVEEADPGWKKGKLGDLIELCYGKALKEEKRIPGKYPVLGSSGIVGYHNEFLVKGPGIVIGRKGTLGVVNYVEDNFFPIDTAFFIKSKTNSGKLFFEYFLLKEFAFEEMSSDSAVPGLNREIAHSMESTIPSNNAISSFNVLCEPLFEKKIKNIRQVQILSHLRDSLLPKLMSGEVRVKL